MAEPRFRTNNVFTAIVQLFRPRRNVWVIAAHARRPAGYLKLEVRLPVSDVREFSDDGEVYAMHTDNWNWAGFSYQGEWYRFIDKAGYEKLLSDFAETDACVRAGDYSFEELNHQVWTEQLAGIVDKFGENSSKVEIRIYPEHTFDHRAAPLFTTRPNDLKIALSRLRNEFGGGTFWVTVFVEGEVCRRFVLNTSDA